MAHKQARHELVQIQTREKLAFSLALVTGRLHIDTHDLTTCDANHTMFT